jgi:hypothetical protein
MMSMSHPHAWSIQHEIREDAESVFIPADLLADAAIGDLVEIGSATSPTRSGHVIDRVHDVERGDFVTVKLDAPNG